MIQEVQYEVEEGKETASKLAGMASENRSGTFAGKSQKK